MPGQLRRRVSICTCSKLVRSEECPGLYYVCDVLPVTGSRPRMFYREAEALFEEFIQRSREKSTGGRGRRELVDAQRS